MVCALFVWSVNFLVKAKRCTKIANLHTLTLFHSKTGIKIMNWMTISSELLEELDKHIVWSCFPCYNLYTEIYPFYCNVFFWYTTACTLVLSNKMASRGLPVQWRCDDMYLNSVDNFILWNSYNNITNSGTPCLSSYTQMQV